MIPYSSTLNTRPMSIGPCASCAGLLIVAIFRKRRGEVHFSRVRYARGTEPKGTDDEAGDREREPLERATAAPIRKGGDGGEKKAAAHRSHPRYRTTPAAARQSVLLCWPPRFRCRAAAQGPSPRVLELRGLVGGAGFTDGAGRRRDIGRRRSRGDTHSVAMMSRAGCET